MELTHKERLHAIAEHGTVQARHDAFAQTLEGVLTVFFADDPRYARAKAITSPRDLARRLTNALASGSDVNKDGPAVAQTCHTLGIARTYKAIRTYLEGRA